MRFPLAYRKKTGYSFWQKTFYSPHHLGQDYSADYIGLSAPTDGEVVRWFDEPQGGKWLVFRDINGKYWRFAHLNRRFKKGRVKEGTTLAETGNSGKYTTAPHLHIDIWHRSPNVPLVRRTWNKSLLIDPEKYIIDDREDKMLQTYKEKRSAKQFTFGVDGKRHHIKRMSVLRALGPHRVNRISRAELLKKPAGAKIILDDELNAVGAKLEANKRKLEAELKEKEKIRKQLIDQTKEFEQLKQKYAEMEVLMREKIDDCRKMREKQAKCRKKCIWRKIIDWLNGKVELWTKEK